MSIQSSQLTSLVKGNRKIGAINAELLITAAAAAAAASQPVFSSYLTLETESPFLCLVEEILIFFLTPPLELFHFYDDALSWSFPFFSPIFNLAGFMRISFHL